jgi:NAD+ dependent glucose-6-phosphate dehydrogenase
MRPDDEEPIRPAPSAGDEDEVEDDEGGPDDEPRPLSPPPALHILHQEEIDEDDEELDEDENEGDLDEAPRTVLITGASGNIGRKLREAWSDVYDLVLIDRHAPPGDDEVIVADLATWDESWVAYFDDVDTVIHLAGNPDDAAPWDALVGPNLDALANVFHASAFGGVERVIFASSNHAMGGYRDLGDMPITVALPPKPDGPYGATKLVGERLGKSLASAFDLTFIAIRIGWVQRGENRPETLPDAWSRGLWLSDDDLVDLFEAAVEADLGGRTFLVVNGMSNNRGMRWDLSEAAEYLGFEPADDSSAEE